jgi:hypothetical protein
MTAWRINGSSENRTGVALPLPRQGKLLQKVDLVRSNGFAPVLLGLQPLEKRLNDRLTSRIAPNRNLRIMIMFKTSFSFSSFS